jgi:hypothetical protein
MLSTKFQFIWESGFRGEDLAFVVRRPLTFHILIFSSETPSAKWTEIWWEASMEGPL